MDRMKTFFIYFLLLAGLFIVLNFLENGLTSSMFSEVKGSAINSDKMSVEVTDSKASNVNGYMKIKITNDSNDYIDTAYAQIDLLDEYGLTAMTEYVTIEDLAPGESKEYKVKYQGNNITGYKVGFIDSLPDKSNIINILGWEIDKTNAFGTGVDLTNIFGINVANAFGNISKIFRKRWSLWLSMAGSIPVWAYVIASLIVLWYI